MRTWSVGDPPAAAELKELISAADAVLISTPEYDSVFSAFSRP